MKTKKEKEQDKKIKKARRKFSARFYGHIY